MAITNQEFQDILDHIEQLIKETIAKELHNLTLPAPQPTPQAADAKEPVTEAQPAVKPPAAIPQSPLPAHQLDFYETIRKVRTQINISHNLYHHHFPRPYFAAVFNDVVSYFGGELTTDWRGRRLQEEAAKRFAYLRTPDGIITHFLTKHGLNRLMLSHRGIGKEVLKKKMLGPRVMWIPQ